MTEVIKRNGNRVEYDANRIILAITKAITETKGILSDQDKEVIEDIESEIYATITENDNIEYGVEAIQDIIENKLMEYGEFETAKKFILYRNERSELRNNGWEMTDLQRDIFEQKYKLENEDFNGFINRISGNNEKIKKIIRDKKFLPAGRILAGRGLNNKGAKITLSNCYVVTQPEDDIESIFDAAKKLARTFSYGGGCGIDVSKLRPRGSKINNAAKNTTGAVSFMDLYSLVTELISQKGRRGALMISMDCSHPDLEEFINVKNNLNKVTKANISIKITDDFMQAVKNNEEYELHFTVDSTGEVIRKKVNAKEIFHKIAESNWRMAEPGTLFWDKISNWHLMSEDKNFRFAGVNPCFTGDMRLLTSNGFKKFDDLNDKEIDIVNINGDISKGKVWCSGEKETIKLILSNKEIITCTPNHVFLTTEDKECEAKDLKGKRIMPYIGNHKIFDEEYIKYGFIQGDGCTGRLGSDIHKGLEVNIGKKDKDIFLLFRNDDYTKMKDNRTIYLKGYNEKLKKIGLDPNQLPTREFPSTYDTWNNLQKSSFLQGCYSANGSIITNHRISYKTTSKKFADKLIETLKNDFNISAYKTTNKLKKVEFYNGEYLCKESYDVNISRYTDIQKFHNEINFYHLYKKIALRNLLIYRVPYVINIKQNGVKKVYDFTEPITHWGVVEGFIAHNCAEEPLPQGGSCLLGSINLSEFIKNPFTENASFDYEDFKNVVQEAVIYLNEILDEGLPLHPLQEQRDTVRDLRQIGCGIMGLADALIKLGIEYGSIESLKFCDNLGYLMSDTAIMQSALLAKEYGSFPKYKEENIFSSPYFNRNTSPETKLLVKQYGLRNSQLLTIAPTGSISTMLGCSGGLEPIFMNSYTRKTETLHDGDTYYKVYTPIVKEYMNINNIKNEEDLPDFFVTAMTLNYKDRIDMQSIWQRHIDASISSTVNVPNSFTIEDVENLYMYAWEQGVKGITIYRDGCERTGILTSDTPKKKTVEDLQEELAEAAIEALKENPNVCPMCGGEMFHSGGCQECKDCGYSPCAI